jgi:hypothetical protein
VEPEPGAYVPGKQLAQEVARLEAATWPGGHEAQAEAPDPE